MISLFHLDSYRFYDVMIFFILSSDIFAWENQSSEYEEKSEEREVEIDIDRSAKVWSREDIARADASCTW